jgi:uncharacterized GH25 family protein
MARTYKSTSHHSLRTVRRAALPSILAIMALTSVATAHDFWLIPDMFGFSADSVVHVNGRSGLRFPSGSAVQPTRVAEARMLGGSTDIRITEMNVEGTSLRLHQKPTAPGQYLVAVALVPRTTRAAPAGLLRYLKAEGGAAEAARLERENLLGGTDTISYTGASYAATVIQVGRGGPRAFARSAGFSLEFIPVNDPGHVHVGDTLHVKIIGSGKAVPGIGIDAVPAADSSSASGAPVVSVSLAADANGVVHLALTKAGPWMIRSAFVSRKAGASANEWDVSRSTYVFNVGESH